MTAWHLGGLPCFMSSISVLLCSTATLKSSNDIEVARGLGFSAEDMPWKSVRGGERGRGGTWATADVNIKWPSPNTYTYVGSKNALTNINRSAIASSDPTHPEDSLKTRWNKKIKSWSGHTIPGTARTTYGGNKL